MARRRDSAGLVIFRRKPELAFFLVHPGGPYWTRKDDGAWSIPKGEIEDGEDKLEAAKRETQEETGFALSGKFIRLPPVRQPSGKVIHPWAIRRRSRAAPSTWSGRRARAAWPRSPRSIAPAGSSGRKPR
jgi:predicted NUDIX family NTP pyrophosphohydrolase